MICNLWPCEIPVVVDSEVDILVAVVDSGVGDSVVLVDVPGEDLIVVVKVEVEVAMVEITELVVRGVEDGYSARKQIFIYRDDIIIYMLEMGCDEEI